MDGVWANVEISSTSLVHLTEVKVESELLGILYRWLVAMFTAITSTTVSQYDHGLNEIVTKSLGTTKVAPSVQRDHCHKCSINMNNAYVWWALRDSNPRPSRCKRDALAN
jgi:hypothetical protein